MRRVIYIDVAMGTLATGIAIACPWAINGQYLPMLLTAGWTYVMARSFESALRQYPMFRTLRNHMKMHWKRDQLEKLLQDYEDTYGDTKREPEEETSGGDEEEVGRPAVGTADAGKAGPLA
jgi:hypothetical protein